jgi:hypothetical protein
MLILVLCVRCASAAIASDELKRRFLKDAPHGWHELEDFFRHSQGVVRDVLTPLAGFPNDGVDYGHTATHRFKRAGDCVLHEVAMNGGVTTVDALNDRYGFSLHQEKNDAPWVLEKIASPNDLRRRLDLTSQILNVPINVGHQTLPWTTSQRGFHLKDVVSLGDDGIVEMQFTSDDALRDDNRILGGAVVLDPAHHWCVRNYTVRIQQDVQGTLIGRVEYEGEVDGILLPKTATQNFTYDSGVRKVRTFTFEELRVARIPPTDFTLTAFGIAEPASNEPSYTLLIVNVAAVLVLAAGVVLRRWAQERTQR